jgi:dephospho-CoA kinase
VVFGDEAARRRLESIIHPRVRARTAELVAAAPPDAVVVNDVPLLVEKGYRFPVVIVVQAPLEERIGRLARDRGMSRAEAESRIAAQATDEQRRAAADVVIDNDGTLDDLRARVDAVWTDLRSRAVEGELEQDQGDQRRQGGAVRDDHGRVGGEDSVDQP